MHRIDIVGVGMGPHTLNAPNLRFRFLNLDRINQVPGVGREIWDVGFEKDTS